MCGIAGVIKVHDPKDGPPPPHLEAIPEKWLDILDDSIKHRGPDGKGRFRDRATRDDGTIVDVALVHRRLSIIDHEGGSQPMVHDGDRLRPDLTYQPGETPIIASEIEPNKSLVAVVFNGCIYNHRELRKELEAAGHVFETDHSDTEVLVHGWREWGDDDGHHHQLQSKLISMHAASVWDRNHASLSRLRDTFGEKPLYQAPLGKQGVYAFASVSSSLSEIAREYILPYIHSNRFRSWIRHGWSSSHSHSSVSEVFPCSSGTCKPDGTPLQGGSGLAHWIDFAEKGTSLTVSQTESLLRTAVQGRLEADVPVGCFLSGGIDSSLITKFAHECSNAVQAFAVRMPSKAYDESTHAQEAADAIGVQLHVLDCSTHPAEDLVALIERLGLPFGDSSLLPSYWVCKAAAAYVRVALSGDGGDELFAGYERHTIGPLAKKLWPIRHLIPERLLPDRDPKSRSSKARRLFAALHAGVGRIAPELAAIYQQRDLNRLLGDHDLSSVDLIKALKNRSCTMRTWDLDNYLRGDLLRKTDTASMHVPIEVRCPFLDPTLAEAAIGTPLEVLMPNGERKGLLKQVARKYLPDHIVDRPKQGFAIPIGEWFRTDYGDMRQLLLDHLRSSDPFPGLEETGVNINMKFVEQMICEHDAAGEKSINPWHGRDHSQRLYMLLVLSIWCKWLHRIRSSNPT